MDVVSGVDLLVLCAVFLVLLHLAGQSFWKMILQKEKEYCILFVCFMYSSLDMMF